MHTLAQQQKLRLKILVCQRLNGEIGSYSDVKLAMQADFPCMQRGPIAMMNEYIKMGLRINHKLKRKQFKLSNYISALILEYENACNSIQEQLDKFDDLGREDFEVCL